MQRISTRLKILFDLESNFIKGGFSFRALNVNIFNKQALKQELQSRTENIQQIMIG